MQLGEFHTMVSQTLKRGNSLDAVIPSRVRQAVRFFERNAPLKYMERWIDLSLEGPADRVIELPFFVRNFKFLRTVPLPGQDVEYRYLLRSDPKDEEITQSGGAPTAYAQIGNRALRFNQPILQPMNLEAVAYCFSDWQATVPTYRHFLLDIAEDLLLYQTLMEMGVYLADMRMAGMYKPLRDEALKSFFSMDMDMEEEGKDGAMEYSGLYR